MADTEMSMDEILSSIRQTLTQEIGSDSSKDTIEEIEDVFILTPEMRCDTMDDLKDRMQRVLKKMTTQETQNRLQITTQELQPLLKEWLIQMRPDLSESEVLSEVNKILPKID